MQETDQYLTLKAPEGMQVNPMLEKKIKGSRDMRKMMSHSPGRQILGRPKDFLDYLNRKEFKAFVKAKIRQLESNGQRYFFQDTTTKQIVKKPKDLDSVVNDMIKRKIELVCPSMLKRQVGYDLPNSSHPYQDLLSKNTIRPKVKSSDSDIFSKISRQPTLEKKQTLAKNKQVIPVQVLGSNEPVLKSL